MYVMPSKRNAEAIAPSRMYFIPASFVLRSFHVYDASMYSEKLSSSNEM